MIQIAITNVQPTLVEIPKDWSRGTGPYKLTIINGLSNQKFEADNLIDMGNGFVYRFYVNFGTEIRNSGQWNLVLTDSEEAMIVNDIANIELTRTDDPEDVEIDDIYYEADEEKVFLQGAQGIQGEIGPQGVQGLNGEFAGQGAQGAEGPQGIQGAQGETGAQGADGIQGENGMQGEIGPQGIQGEKGADGIQHWRRIRRICPD